MRKKTQSSGKLRFNHPTNQKVNVQAVIASLFIITAILGRLMYLSYLGDNDQEGDFLNFRWLSIFLYNFGVEISFLSFGALMWVSTLFHPPKSKSKRLFRFVSVLMMLMAFFFMSWIFTDKPYWSDKIEIVFAVLIAIPTTILFVTSIMFFSREIKSATELKSMVVNSLTEFRNVYVLGLAKNANKLESLNGHPMDLKQKSEILIRLKLERKNIINKLDRSLREYYKSFSS